MRRSTTRWMLAGFMALAALGGVAALDVGSATAQAEPSVSPFAGSWSGTFSVADSEDAEFQLLGTFDWMISDEGRITGTYSRTTAPGGGTFVGHIRADGDLMVVMHNEGGGVPHEGAAVIDGDGILLASATDTFASPWGGIHTWSLIAALQSD